MPRDTHLQEESLQGKRHKDAAKARVRKGEKVLKKNDSQFGLKKSSRQTDYNYLYHADTVGATDETDETSP